MRVIRIFCSSVRGVLGSRFGCLFSNITTAFNIKIDLNYLSLSASHYVLSEPEWENSYPDILLLKRPTITTKYNFIFELKYIKKSDKSKRVDPKDKTSEKIVEKVAREARTQLSNYLKTDDAKRISSLKAWVLVLVGREWQVVEEVLAD